jgi:glycosyltransferase involved in cell wall biosynthesis
MKILVGCDTYFPDYNGAARFARQLATSLAQKNHEVAIIAPSTSNRYFIDHVDGLKVYRIPSIPLPVYNRFRIVVPVLTDQKIKKIVAEFKPDIIHVQGHFTVCSAIVYAAKKKNIPMVGTNHLMPENIVHYFHFPDPLEKQLAKIIWGHVKKVFSQLEVVTTPTTTASQLLYNVGFKKTVHAVSNGIDIHRFNPHNKDLKERYHLPFDRPIFLTVSRLDPEKRIDLVIKAFAKSLAKGPAHLLIAGKGQEQPNLEKLTRKLGISEQVTFTGFLSDEELPMIYASADVFVIAGVAELQSIVTMEAMATGLPIIAANAVALPELIKPGQNGYLFKIDDLNELASYIQELSLDPDLRQKLGSNSRDLIYRHNLDGVINQFEELYDIAINLKKK